VRVGYRVTKEKVLKTSYPKGTITKINNDYVVVVWDTVNGHWHYTPVQAVKLELIECANEDR